MIEPFLLSRVLLQFRTQSDDLLGQLSAVARTPDGHLWLGSDEFNTIERLSPLESYVFGNHRQFAIADYLDLRNLEDEIDIEGMDYVEPYLWITGSHSPKRSKTKGKKPEKDIQRLTKIKTELNRYLIARIPVLGGELLKSCSHPTEPDKTLTAACLQTTEHGNVLIDALKDDPHLGLFTTIPLPSKENGIDVEGLAVFRNRVFLGLRGPVLRGWALLLEIEVEESEPGTLTLKPIGQDGRPYRKHFVNLNGLGVRELCLHGEDLVILAGPTMAVEGVMQVFKIGQILDCPSDSLFEQASGRLELLFDLPFTIGSDHAEGLALFPYLGDPDALLVVYDEPDACRRVKPKAVFADVFRLSPS